MKIGKKGKIAMFTAIGLALVGGGIVLYKFINKSKVDAGQAGAKGMTSENTSTTNNTNANIVDTSNLTPKQVVDVVKSKSGSIDMSKLTTDQANALRQSGVPIRGGAVLVSKG